MQSQSRSLRKSSRVRRLSEKAIESDFKDQFINNLNKVRANDDESSQLFKRRKLNQFQPVNNFDFINVKTSNIDDEEDFLFNFNSTNSSILSNLDEELKETELRISQLFNSSPEITSPPTTPTQIEPPLTTKSSTDSNSLEDFLNYDLMPSLTDESDLESTTEYLPQCFDYRSNHDSVNLSLIDQDSISVIGKTRGFLNAIKKRSGDVFLTDGMFNQFI